MLRWKILSLALLASLLTACPSLSTLHTARPVEAGEVEFTVAPGLLGASLDGGFGGLPQTEFQVRYGLNESMDFGLKYSNFVMLTFDFNWMLIDTESFALSLDPTISSFYLPSSTGSVFVIYAWLPVLADVVSTSSFDLTLGLRPGFATIGGSNSEIGSVAVSGFLLGFSVGAKIMLGESFGLLPELSVALPMGADTPGTGTPYLFSAGLGFVF